jgi:hypothetical protein
MIRPLLAILLCSCSTPLPEPCLPAPGEWVDAALPSGVLARAEGVKCTSNIVHISDMPVGRRSETENRAG